MQKLSRLAILGAMVGLAASGCASLRVVPPDVTLVDLKFTDLTLFETTGEFTVRLANENLEPLRISGGVFRLYLNGAKVGKALSSEAVEVPRLGTATERVSLHVNNVALMSRLASWLEEPVLDYQIKTRLFLETPYGNRRLNFENSGEFSWGQQADDPGSQDMASESSDG